MFRIEETSDDDDSDAEKPLQTELLLQINAKKHKDNEVHRILWCPYLPMDEDESAVDSSSARLLVLTHGNVAEIFDIDMVLEDHSVGAAISTDAVQNGKQTICDHSDVIRDASFSPDGTALATASADGQVKFFQVYMRGSDPHPRCLHQWKPHDGQPVSCLFFLDNHRDHLPGAQIWKYALTGSCAMSGTCMTTELKLWSCENWTCLQTVQIKPTDGKPVALKAVLDLSAQYVLLSDIYRKIVYVLQLEISEEDGVRFVSVSEFATPSSFMSMALLEAGVRKVADKHTLGEDDDSDDDEDDEIVEDPQATSREATVINFLLVQPKSLQECRIVYDDAYSQPQISAAIEAIVKKEPIGTPTEELAKAADKITLMSPEVFGAGGTPKIKEEPPTPTDVAPKRGSGVFPSIVAMASGGSSPSREVQDILGDSEEQGGLGAEIVITEEDEEDEDEDIVEIQESDEDSDELSKMLDKANAKIKMEQQQDPLAMKIKEEPSWPATSPMIKKEMKEEWKAKPIKEEIKIKQEPQAASPILASSASCVVGPSAGGAAADLNVIMSRLADMTALIQTQRAEVQNWREEMRALRREDLGQIKSVLDDSTCEASSEMKKTTQVILNSIKTNVKNNIAEEVRKATPLMIQAASSSLQEALQKEVNNKVLKADLQMKDALNKLVNSKSFSENVASSIAASLAPALHSNFKDAMASTLLPAFEKSMQNLFAQLSTTFNKGLKDYEGQLKTHVNKQVEPVVKELRDAVHKQKAPADLEKKLANLIKTEIRNMATMTPVTTPASPATPNPGQMSMADIQSKIQGYLREGNVNDAFLTALSANNLAVVVATCEMVNPSQILNQVPCPLSQEVLLSLIQQLGKSQQIQFQNCTRF